MKFLFVFLAIFMLADVDVVRAQVARISLSSNTNLQPDGNFKTTKFILPRKRNKTSQPAVIQNGTVCEEIGMSSQMLAGCMLTRQVYKGFNCYKCRISEKCSPECRGGKMCVDQKCICPPARGLVDCNGVCVNGAQCKPSMLYRVKK